MLLGGVALWLAPLAPPAGAEACAARHLRFRFTAFHPDSAPSSKPFYAAAEPAVGTELTSFKILAEGDPDCGGEAVSVSYGTRPVSADPASDFDMRSARVPMYAADGHTAEVSHTDSVPIRSDGATPEAVVESLELVLSDPEGADLGDPSTAPIFIIDGDGADRIAFDGAGVTASESDGETRVPIFRAGPAAVAASVSYTIAPGPGAGAVAGRDFGGSPSGTISFSPGQRVASIAIPITNDRETETNESATITLTSATGATLEAPTSTTLTITDNEESLAPQSRLHHPRQGFKYSREDFRIRELHVFTTDQGGSRVSRAEIALRRKIKGGRCTWWSGKGWKKGDCSSQRWIPLPSYETDFYYYRLRALRPSMGSKVESYTAFSRATDGAGNVERRFTVGRNANTFEVKKG